MKRPLLLPVVLAGLVLPAAGAQAKPPPEYWEDAKSYVRSPLRWESRECVQMGGVVLGVAAAYSLDQTVHDLIGPDSTHGTPTGRARDYMPLAAMLAGTFDTGLLASDERLVSIGP